MTGNTKEKLQLLLPYIDERFAGSKHALTETQSNFLRDITIVNHYSDNESPYSLDDLDWLMVRFQANPLPQRALLIVFLVSTDELPRDAAAQIRAVLAGTPGEKWLAD
jgi:hypothetical protein